MEKLNVEVDQDEAKKASAEAAGKCPRCGAKLLPAEDANVPRCPSCGTEPFESR